MSLTDAPAQRGRNRVTSRALGRVSAAVAADALGVDASSVSVDVNDDNGALGLSVSAPIRVVSLRRVVADPSAVERSGGSILDRASRAQGVIRDAVSELTGASVGRVAVRIEDASIRSERRVL